MKKLFVGNIPHSTTEAELRTLFAAHGAVEQVSVVTDRDTGRSRGFAFVEMTDSGEAEKGIEGITQLKSTARGPEDLLVSQELGEQISRTIDELPVVYRELILLRHLQGMSYEDIARVKQLPLGTVKNRLFRAREFLRKRLDS